jgi:Pentapeptide repeats (8 copies)
MNRSQKIILWISGIVLAIGLSWAIYWVPVWMASRIPFATTKDYADFITSNRSIIVSAVGGFAVAITIFFTYGNFRTSQQTLRVSQETLATGSFSKAVEMLGNDKISVRLGGIHALARIAKSSQSDYFPVMQIVTGHLRGEFSRYEEKPSQRDAYEAATCCPVEVQLILTIVGERYWPDPAGYAMDLSDALVTKAWVQGAKLYDIYFWNTIFDGANFDEAILDGADFKGALLKSCSFKDASFIRTDFNGARIVDPQNLTKAQLERAINVDPAFLATLP